MVFAKDASQSKGDSQEVIPYSISIQTNAGSDLPVGNTAHVAITVSAQNDTLYNHILNSDTP
jgi:hypothetical protein